MLRVALVIALALILTACGASPETPSDASVAPDTSADDANPCLAVNGLSCACGAALGAWRCAGAMPVCVCDRPDAQADTVDASDATDAPTIACDSGVYCPTVGGCVNTLTSAAHCGSCGNRCQTGRACVNGSCAMPNAGVSDARAPDARAPDAIADVPRDIDLSMYPECRTNTDCNRSLDDGCEVNLNTDAMNCGACGIRCGGNPARHVAPSCRGAVCSGVCASCWWDCDNDASDGCESDRTAMAIAEMIARGSCRTVL